ncbi:DUF4157 domain-containing protein [Lyngbya sp. CCY1209]|uniref:eCIS core domain-containing protein n=1 Tax=Lyngbya sp. CCY1209 TaxID=2886103 RepID=UPI002D20F318|nr:DUF4157 domain-containing protein [Lyngbya sp. CCY1209]MEB3885549.1 DUF4157 domain-containing protein [Lyngbya sp. CCY1209]
MKIQRRKKRQNESPAAPVQEQFQSRPFQDANFAPPDKQAAPQERESQPEASGFDFASIPLFSNGNSTPTQPIQRSEEEDVQMQAEPNSPLHRQFQNLARRDNPQNSAPPPPIQAQLTVGAVGDKYEQEADRVADAVVDRIQSPPTTKEVQKQEEETLQQKPQLSTPPTISKLQKKEQPETVQRESEEEDEDVQMKPQTTEAGGEVSADFESSLRREKGGGQPLNENLQSQMGSAMGADFSGVRIHQNSPANQLNQSIQAKAFTTGQDIFFKQGEYQPESRGGQKLIAHELTHVVQQGGASNNHAVQADFIHPIIQRKLSKEQIKHANRIRKARGLPLLSVKETKKLKTIEEAIGTPVATNKSTKSKNIANPENVKNNSKSSGTNSGSIPNSPEYVWANADTLGNVSLQEARKILESAFYSNWFLAQEYLLYTDKWVQLGKEKQEAEAKLDNFKKLMKIFIQLRQEETNNLLKDIQTELWTQNQFKEMKYEEQVLAWGSAGSTSLTSDIDYNLKGAGSIQAVGLFNQYFKTKLNWALDPGTVYDVNVYAQDFMTPSLNKEGKPSKPFDMKKIDDKNSTITPVQEIQELNAPEARESLGFEAFSLNQDVWSMLKMRIYMKNSEWNNYKQEILPQPQGYTSDDEFARRSQIENQIEDAEGYYQDYQSSLDKKIKEIENSGDEIYQKMRSMLDQGKAHLSHHQTEESKKMMAANLIYEEKLQTVSQLRQELQNLKSLQPLKKESQIKAVGIKLKNALSEAIIYSNEAYFTQGAVHFSVIGQQIGKGKSTLIMSQEEHLHSFREQVGDTLKVLSNYEDNQVIKAASKAGKYIDRMAKSAIPIMDENQPVGYQELAEIGAEAAKLKSDKTKVEELRDKSSEKGLNDAESQELSDLENTVDLRNGQFPDFVKARFETVAQLRETVIKVGKQVEIDFRKKQRENNQNQNPM